MEGARCRGGRPGPLFFFCCFFPLSCGAASSSWSLRLVAPPPPLPPPPFPPPFTLPRPRCSTVTPVASASLRFRPRPLLLPVEAAVVVLAEDGGRGCRACSDCSCFLGWGGVINGRPSSACRSLSCRLARSVRCAAKRRLTSASISLVL